MAAVTLNDLERSIKMKLTLVERMRRKTMATCYQLGKDLSDARRLCPRGEWEHFLNHLNLPKFDGLCLHHRL